MKTALVLLAFALSSVGCRPAVIPDPLVPHRLSAETTVEAWVRRPDGTFSKQKIKVAEGWWIASPTLIGQ